MFRLPDLPYAYDNLSPVISEETMHFHHDKHHATYVKTLNRGCLIRRVRIPGSLEEVITTSASQTPKKLFNNAAQAWNHAFFWTCMTPERQSPNGDLARAIETFGGLEKLKTDFVTAGTGQFGSGWVWLSAGNGGTLELIATHDADNPLVGKPWNAAAGVRRVGARLLSRLPERSERLSGSLVRLAPELGVRRAAARRRQGRRSGLAIRGSLTPMLSGDSAAAGLDQARHRRRRRHAGDPGQGADAAGHRSLGWHAPGRGSSSPSPVVARRAAWRC